MHFCWLKMESQIHQQIERIISNSYLHCAFPSPHWSFRNKKKHSEHKMFGLEWIFIFEMCLEKHVFFDHYKELFSNLFIYLFIYLLLITLFAPCLCKSPSAAVSALTVKSRLVSTIKLVVYFLINVLQYGTKNVYLNMAWRLNNWNRL